MSFAPFQPPVRVPFIATLLKLYKIFSSLQRGRDFGSPVPHNNNKNIFNMLEVCLSFLPWFFKTCNLLELQLGWDFKNKEDGTTIIVDVGI